MNFKKKHQRIPGSDDSNYENDIKEVKEIASNLAKKYGIENYNLDYAHELVRYGGTELHNIASFMGGVTAQEVIKTITHQFLTLNNTFVFNGVHSDSCTIIA